MATQKNNSERGLNLPTQTTGGLDTKSTLVTTGVAMLIAQAVAGCAGPLDYTVDRKPRMQATTTPKQAPAAKMTDEPTQVTYGKGRRAVTFTTDTGPILVTDNADKQVTVSCPESGRSFVVQNTTVPFEANCEFGAPGAESPVKAETMTEYRKGLEVSAFNSRKGQYLGTAVAARGTNKMTNEKVANLTVSGGRDFAGVCATGKESTPFEGVQNRRRLNRSTALTCTEDGDIYADGTPKKRKKALATTLKVHRYQKTPLASKRVRRFRRGR